MKRILLAAALLVTASSAFAEWKLVESNNAQEIYIEPSKLRSDGDTVKHWDLFSYQKTQIADGIKYRSRIVRTQTDCKNERFRVLLITLYSEAMGRGSVVRTHNIQTEWQDIVPGTVADNVSRLLCD